MRRILSHTPRRLQPNFLTVYGLPTAPPPWYHPRTMNTNLNTIPAADLPKLKYTIWQPLTNDWSPPITFKEAQEFAARDPELHACAILPSGEYTDPAPFAETYKRANVPRDLETATALRQRNERVQAQRAAATAPQPSPAPARQPSAAPLPRSTNQAAAIPPETISLLTHALRLFLCVTYGTLYISAAGAIIGGLASGEKTLAIAGVIVAAATMILHEYLTRRAD